MCKCLGNRPVDWLMDETRYRLRSARPGDAAAIAGVYTAAYPDDSDYPLQTASGVREELFEDETVRPFVIDTEDGTIAAVAAITDDAIEPGTAEICRLAVAPSHQGNGLARRLLDHRLAVVDATPPAGPVFSRAVTNHPYSQRNLERRKFVPVAFLKRVGQALFGTDRESQVLFVHRESLQSAERPLYVPEQLHSRVTQLYETVRDVGANRTIHGLDGIGPIADRQFDEAGDSAATWMRSTEQRDAAIETAGPGVVLAIDATTPAARAQYQQAHTAGLRPAGIVPDWLAVAGERHDALLYQARTPTPTTTVAVTDAVKQLITTLGIEYTQTDDEEKLRV